MLEEGREVVMVGDRVEVEAKVDARDGVGRISIPTMHDTRFFPSLFTETLGNISLMVRERTMMLNLRPGNFLVTMSCTTDNCMDPSEFSWNWAWSLDCMFTQTHYTNACIY